MHMGNHLENFYHLSAISQVLKKSEYATNKYGMHFGRPNFHYGSAVSNFEQIRVGHDCFWYWV